MVSGNLNGESFGTGLQAGILCQSIVQLLWKIYFLSGLNSTQTNQRRLLLRVAIKIMLWISLMIGAWIIFSPLLVNSRPVNGKVVETVFDISEIESGDVQIVEWFSKPLIIAHRTQATEAQLREAGNDLLQDPLSSGSTQPEFATNPLRSATAGWFVSLGIGTSSGCALRYSPPTGVLKNVVRRAGIFTDPCDSSRYDMAGRAFIDQAARKNTTIPVWRFERDKIIVSTLKRH